LDCVLQDDDKLQSCRWFPAFQRNLQLPSSGCELIYLRRLLLVTTNRLHAITNLNVNRIFLPRRGHEGSKWVKRYRPYSWEVNATHWPLYPRETRYLLWKRQGGPPGWSGRVRKTSLSPRFDRRTVQPVAIRYADGAMPAHS
jgi:hypothetical protein